ncbi:Ubiquitin thioesterase OTU1 [Erysiphe neolycopersici]|uniref:Ubiquitin thioesterase OTU n=1 Tax=Erysiphe neolycopersici TaxID=212602 RepID=A0A420I8A0_9PEZI|nr:Ubiquitin thioesterase OTU1 [Erysiphe neolycopersici]
MRLRVRGPKGASTLTLPEEATLADLIENISIFTGISNFNVKYGYPPRSLNLNQKDASQKLSELDVKIDGEQLTICPNPMLRIMPDDNSCLFRAFGSAVLPGDDKSMPELRSVVASVIQTEPDTYTKAVLEKSPDDYCRWIQTPNAWGGAIELGILAKYFDIEICSIDVETLRIDKFNEGRANRCILVYSGIHYDTIALSPVDAQHYNFQSTPELDQRVWDSRDTEILETAVELCRILQAKHYYTNTVKMRIKCKSCSKILYGEKDAAKHAQQSGHYDMEQL